MTEKIDGRRNNRPPAEHQFQPGQSGNRRGRPKSRPREYSEDQLFRDVLHIAAMKVKVDLGRGKKEYTLQEAMILRMFTKAANGDNGMVKAAIPLLTEAYLRNENNNREAFAQLRSQTAKVSNYPTMREIGLFHEKLDELRKYTKPL